MTVSLISVPWGRRNCGKNVFGYPQMSAGFSIDSSFIGTSGMLIASCAYDNARAFYNDNFFGWGSSSLNRECDRVRPGLQLHTGKQTGRSSGGRWEVRLIKLPRLLNVGCCSSVPVLTWWSCQRTGIQDSAAGITATLPIRFCATELLPSCWRGRDNLSLAGSMARVTSLWRFRRKL
jgi:hypothetical protein